MAGWGPENTRVLPKAGTGSRPQQVCQALSVGMRKPSACPPGACSSVEKQLLLNSSLNKCHDLNKRPQDST